MTEATLTEEEREALMKASRKALSRMFDTIADRVTALPVASDVAVPRPAEVVGPPGDQVGQRRGGTMSNRVELARPFAVVDQDGIAIMYETEPYARLSAGNHDIVVRLTAERVEGPIPEAKSGWEWFVTIAPLGTRFLNVRKPNGETSCVASTKDGRPEWERHVPPCDHAHVRELLRREGVEA